MPSGLHCQAPAMRGQAFCYHHARREAAARKRTSIEARIEIPTVLDQKGINVVAGRILQSLGRGCISPRRAAVLLYGLQMVMGQDTQGCDSSEHSVLDQLPDELFLAAEAIMNKANVAEQPTQ